MRRTWFYSSGTLKLWSTTSRMRKPSDLQWDPSEMCENCLALQEVQLNPNSRAPGGNQDYGTCGSGEVIRKDEQREIVLMVENSVDRRISNLHASVLHAKVGPFGHPYEEPGLYHTCKHTETGWALWTLMDGPIYLQQRDTPQAPHPGSSWLQCSLPSSSEHAQTSSPGWSCYYQWPRDPESHKYITQSLQQSTGTHAKLVISGAGNIIVLLSSLQNAWVWSATCNY